MLQFLVTEIHCVIADLSYLNEILQLISVAFYCTSVNYTYLLYWVFCLKRKLNFVCFIAEWELVTDKHFLCPLYCPVRYFITRISIAKCFINCSKWFRCQVMFHIEHTLCWWIQHVRTCTTSGVICGLVVRVAWRVCGIGTTFDLFLYRGCYSVAF